MIHSLKLHIALAHTYPWHENAEESFIGGRYHTPHSTRDIYLLYMGMGGAISAKMNLVCNEKSKDIYLLSTIHISNSAFFGYNNNV